MRSGECFNDKLAMQAFRTFNQLYQISNCFRNSKTFTIHVSVEIAKLRVIPAICFGYTTTAQRQLKVHLRDFFSALIITSIFVCSQFTLSAMTGRKYE